MQNMRNFDINPTHKFGEFLVRPGKHIPFGATVVPQGVNFSIYSGFAKSCELVLYEKGEEKPYEIIPFPDEFRLGNVFAMLVFNLDFERFEYTYRMDGEFNVAIGHRFDKTKDLLDPYAKAISGRDVWGEGKECVFSNRYRSRIVLDDFDWEGDRQLEIPMRDLVIYEMHVRGFTRHCSSNTKYPGTFAAIMEKIPYLKELGVNCVELMPVFEFDEFNNIRVSPIDDKPLKDYWGYNTVGFFAPKAGYAASGKHGLQVEEFKKLVKELHRNGIEVMLDVVFNHTAEGNELGPYISFKGIDNKTYYMLSPDGKYYNFSGCGNTLNCNHPVVRNMILDCLRYWVEDFHIDGFRFDLASILGRNQDGSPMQNPPLIESLAFDPVLAKTKLVAEAWDAGGLYQVGSFPSWGRWAEWNGKYRDDIRRFVKGDEGVVGAVAQRILGSPDLYDPKFRGTAASVNFITCHDGFTLMDLYSYNNKHNEANGENNCDGINENYSWNCGVEGETKDPKVLALRKKMMKNAVAILLMSRGVPMLFSGDEFGNTQFGNNNAYCQDNEIAWLDWSLLKKNNDIFRFFKILIEFRKRHSVLRSKLVHDEEEDSLMGYPPVSWHGVRAWNADFSWTSRTLAVMYCRREKNNADCIDIIYMAMNMHWELHAFELPKLPKNYFWYKFIDTAMKSPYDICDIGKEIFLKNQGEIPLDPRSIVVLIAKKSKRA